MLQVVMDFGTIHVFGLAVPLRVLGYGLMMVLGFISGILLARWRARRAGEDPDVITRCGVLALVGGVIGARGAFVIQHWRTQFAGRTSVWRALADVTSGGLIWYGGLGLGAAAVVAYLLLKRVPLRRYLDIVAPSIMLGLAFGRAGCLLNGCCYGAPCHEHFPLGVRFPMYSRPLVKLGGLPGPFADDTRNPSPVYAVQFHHGQVHPDRRLVAPGPDRSVSIVQWHGSALRLPTDLHGPLDQDQLAVLTWPPAEAQKKFLAVAGDDGGISRPEWQAHLGRLDGLLRGSEVWARAIRYDDDRDGRLSREEFHDYLTTRWSFLARRFGNAEESQAGIAMRAGSPAWKAADAYLREDLFALAAAERARPVLPTQALGLINALLLAALLTWFSRVRRREGQVCAVMLVLYPITRFVLEWLRDDNPHDLLAGLWTHNQWTSVALVAAGAVMLAVLHRSKPSAGATLAQRIASAEPTERPRPRE